MPMRPYDSLKKFLIPQVSSQSPEETKFVRQSNFGVSFSLIRNPGFAKYATVEASKLA